MDQVKLLRKLTGVERLEQAFLLSDFVRELSRKNITQRSLRGRQVREKLKKRLWYAYDSF